ncbi:MAG: 30S ribosomal protein S5 [bacterium]
MDNQNIDLNEPNKLEERVLLIRRISKKTTGGNHITFASLVIVGDNKGRVGIGMGRSQEIPPAIKKAITKAKKNMIDVPVTDKFTIPHPITVKFKAAKIILKPAPEGSGLKVGNVARVILELAGVKNASGKILRSKNKIVNAYAIFKALQNLKPLKVGKNVK